MTKWPVQKQTHRITQKHAEHLDTTDIGNKIIVCVRVCACVCVCVCVCV